MDPGAREWDRPGARWAAMDLRDVRLYDYSWGVQRLLMSQGVGGASDPDVFREFIFKLYGPWAAVARRYVRDQDGNPARHLERVLAAVSSAGALPFSENPGNAKTLPSELPIAHEVWSEAYGHIYSAKDADGLSFMRGAIPLMPGPAPSLGDTLELFERVSVTLDEIAIPLTAGLGIEAFESAFARPELIDLLHTLSDNSGTDAPGAALYRLNRQIEMDGPFTTGPIPCSSLKAPDTDVLPPANPLTPDQGDLTRLKYLSEEVFSRSALRDAERDTLANPFDCVPPSRSYLPDPRSRYVLGDSYFGFRRRYFEGCVEIFVEKCLEIHLNAVHYAFLANRRAIPPNAATLHGLLASGNVRKIARTPVWNDAASNIGSRNAIEAVEGYRISEMVLGVITSAHKQYAFPFAFANMAEELCSPAFAHNSPATRDELECIVHLCLDAQFGRAYMLLGSEGADDEDAHRISWMISRSQTEWSSNVLSDMAFEAARRGQIPVRASWDFWTCWFEINNVATERGAPWAIRDAALDVTRSWYDGFMQKLTHATADFPAENERRIADLLESWENLVLQRYLLWLWGSSRFTADSLFRTLLDTWSRAGGVEVTRDPAVALHAVLADRLAVDPFQRVYIPLNARILASDSARRLLETFWVEEDDVVTDLQTWAALVPHLGIVSEVRVAALGKLSALAEHTYEHSILKATHYRSMFRKWIRPSLGLGNYIFSIRNLIQETSAFDILARRASRLLCPIVAKRGQTWYKQVFVIATQQPWFRKYHDVTIRWTISQTLFRESQTQNENEDWAPDEELVTYKRDEMRVLNKIVVPTKVAIDHVFSLKPRPRDSSAPRSDHWVKLLCTVTSESVSSHTIGSDTVSTRTPVSSQFQVILEVR